MVSFIEFDTWRSEGKIVELILEDDITDELLKSISSFSQETITKILFPGWFSHDFLENHTSSLGWTKKMSRIIFDFVYTDDTDYLLQEIFLNEKKSLNPLLLACDVGNLLAVKVRQTFSSSFVFFHCKRTSPLLFSGLFLLWEGQAFLPLLFSLLFNY